MRRMFTPTPSLLCTTVQQSWAALVAKHGPRSLFLMPLHQSLLNSAARDASQKSEMVRARRERRLSELFREAWSALGRKCLGVDLNYVSEIGKNFAKGPVLAN